jgi:hypothetical protein
MTIARIPLPGKLALWAQRGNLDADLRISALLDTPSVQSVHHYYPFTQEDGGRLALMAVESVDRLTILVGIRRFPGVGAADSHSLRSHTHVRMHHFVLRYTHVPFDGVWGACGENSYDVFLLLFMHGTF